MANVYTNAALLGSRKRLRKTVGLVDVEKKKKRGSRRLFVDWILTEVYNVLYAPSAHPATVSLLTGFLRVHFHSWSPALDNKASWYDTRGVGQNVEHYLLDVPLHYACSASAHCWPTHMRASANSAVARVASPATSSSGGSYLTHNSFLQMFGCWSKK